MTRTRRFRRVALVAPLCLLLTALTAMGAASSGSSGSDADGDIGASSRAEPNGEEHLDDQELRELGLHVPGDEVGMDARLTDALESLHELGITLDVNGGEDYPEGFVSVFGDRKLGKITIVWKGDPPDDIARVRREHPGVMIEVVQGGLTARELDAASDLIGERLRDELDGKGYPALVGSLNDGSAVEVVVHALDPGLTVQHVKIAIARLVSVPVVVQVVDENPLSLATGTRQTDVSPYYGGAGIRIPARSNSYCSTGFSVKGLSTGTRYMTTAFHCIDVGGGLTTGAVNAEGGNKVGDWHRTGAGVEKDRDAALITISGSQTNAGRAYWSHKTSSISHPIAGFKGNAVSNVVCTGGARTGTHCDLEIDRKYHLAATSDGTLVKGAWLAIAPTLLDLAVAPGDSGGPVYRHNSGGDGKHYARGAIMGQINADVGLCYLHQDKIHKFSGGMRCSSQVVFVAIKGILEDLNVSLA